jgi:16S rRNA processing protein RimM
MKPYIEVGFLAKSFGTKGLLKANIDQKFKEDVLKSTAVFLNVNGNYIPYFIEEIVEDGFLRIKLEDIDSKEAAVAIQSRKLFLRARDISIDFNEEISYSLIGYSIYDQTTEETIGSIKELLEMPKQILAVVEYCSVEVFIPLHEELIDLVDVDKQRINMNLPEGLLDINE